MEQFLRAFQTRRLNRQAISLLLTLALLVTSFATGINTQVVVANEDEKFIDVELSIIDDKGNQTNTVVQATYGQDTALDVLIRGLGDSNVGIETYDWGEMITSINGLVAKDTFFWSLYINECTSKVGASSYIVELGDKIEFRYISWESEPNDPDKCSQLEYPEQDPPGETHEQLLEQIQQILDEVSEQILANGIQSDWEAVTLSKANKNVPDSYRYNLFNRVKNKAGDLGAATEYAKTVLVIRALGGDPQNISGYDLIAKLYNHPDLIQSVNGLVFGLIALDSDNYSLPNNPLWTKEKLVTELLKKQHTLGGWDWTGNSSEADMTGMALAALAPYSEQKDVQEAIGKAIQWLSEEQTKNGGFVSWGKESLESASQVVVGLTSNKLDPTAVDFSKEKGNIITNILSFYGGEGKFPGEWGHEFPTEQALQALVGYQLYVTGQSPLYIFREIDKVVWDFATSGEPGNEKPTLPGSETGQKITLSVHGVNHQTLLAPKEINLLENDTPFSVLLREASESQVIYRGSGSSIYIESIMGLAEFSYGPESGWNFSVDGYFPSVSAGAYRLFGGEHVRFLYTTNLGADVGNPSGGSKPQTPTGVTQDVQKSLEELAKASLPVDNRLPIHAVTQTVQVLNSEKRMNEQTARQLQEELASNHVQLKEEINKLEQENVLEDNKAEVRLVIPAHALPSARQISVTEQNAENRTEFVSSIYEFLPKGTKFNEPVYISIKVPLLIGDLDNLALAWLDEETNQWIPIPAVVDAENGIITGKVNHFTKFAVVDKTKATAYQEELNKKVKQAIRAIAQSEWRSGEYNLWEILGLYHLGEFSAVDYLQHIEQELEETKGEYRRVTDLSTAILGINLAGENPERFAGINLVNKLYNDPNITRQGSNGIIFSLITLDMAGLELPKDTLWTKDALFEWLLTNQHNNGSWSLAPNGEQSVDITAMAISSLAPYKDRKDVKQALDKATAWLASVQLEQGGFNYASQHPESSESIAQVIIGLTANQINPLVIPFAKEKGNPLSAVFEYQMSSGQFEHTKGKGADYIATEQALMALIAYNLFVEQEMSIFDQLQKKEQFVSNPTLPFTDKDLISAWALSSVEKAYEQNLMVGISAAQFAPKEWLTRAQFTTLLLRLLEEEPASNGEVIFDDVPLNVWFADSVNHARELGIINGTSPTTFHPNKPVTRQEMAIMLANAFRLKSTQEHQELVDLGDAWDIAQESIAAVYEHGIMVGVGNGQFAPRAQVTREMAATAIVNMVDLIMDIQE